MTRKVREGASFPAASWRRLPSSSRAVPAHRDAMCSKGADATARRGGERPRIRAAAAGSPSAHPLSTHAAWRHAPPSTPLCAAHHGSARELGNGGGAGRGRLAVGPARKRTPRLRAGRPNPQAPRMQPPLCWERGTREAIQARDLPTVDSWGACPRWDLCEVVSWPCPPFLPLCLLGAVASGRYLRVEPSPGPTHGQWGARKSATIAAVRLWPNHEQEPPALPATVPYRTALELGGTAVRPHRWSRCQDSWQCERRPADRRAPGPTASLGRHAAVSTAPS